MRHSLLVPQLTLKEATWFAGDHGKGMTEQSSCQAAQSNPHACKQKLNGIISILSSTWSLLLILFLMALCIFTESHLKYFSDVFKILTKGWKEIKPNASEKNWNRGIHRIPAMCQTVLAGGREFGVWGKKQQGVLCKCYIKYTYSGDTLTQFRDSQASTRGNIPSAPSPGGLTSLFSTPGMSAWTYYTIALLYANSSPVSIWKAFEGIWNYVFCSLNT